MITVKNQQLLICITAAAMLGGFVLFGYMPLHKMKKSVNGQIAEQKYLISDAEKNQSRLKTIKETLQNKQKSADNFNLNIPDIPNLGVFVQNVTNLMNNHNLTEQQVQPENRIEADELNFIPVNIKCQGSLQQIFDFFQSLQASDRAVRIEQVTLNSIGQYDGKISLQAKTIIYYRKKTGQV